MPEQPTILVVDDNALVRRMLSRALEGEGYTVSSAANGREALESVARQPFDVVVSDMDMPEMDGLTFIAEARKRNADLPVVVVSGNDQLDTVIEAMKRGASDYILKDQDAQTTVVLAVQKAREKYELAMQNKRLTEQLADRNAELESLNKRLTRFNEELEERVTEATEEIRQRLTETRALNRVASGISSVMDVQPLLALIADAGKEVIAAEACALMLLDPETQELYVPAAVEEGGEVPHETDRLKVGDGIGGWVARTGEPLRVDDAYNDPRFDPESDAAAAFRTKSVLCVPLKIQDNVRGILQMARSDEQPVFDEEAVDTLVSFSHHAAIAIENARLYEETKRQAKELRDSMESIRWLQLQRDKLGKYVPESVVEDIERNREKALAATTRIVECTILFADIEGFTRASERADPTTLVRMLNKYHSATHACIKSHSGVLDKFIGDGTMAVFLPAEEGEADDHPLRAIRCAIAMQHAVAELDPEWQEAGLGALNVRVGVNMGNVISGSIGAEARMDYTVVGDAVNVAARLETGGRAGEVLIGEGVYERVKHETEAERLQPVYVKNRTQPVQPYSIRVLHGGGDPTGDHADTWSQPAHEAQPAEDTEPPSGPTAASEGESEAAATGPPEPRDEPRPEPAVEAEAASEPESPAEPETSEERPQEESSDLPPATRAAARQPRSAGATAPNDDVRLL